MTPERFAALADAYGGNLDRWPSRERDGARALLQEQPAMDRVLIATTGLDSALAAWTMPQPSPALAARIAATVADRHARTRRLRLWLSGLGATTALASGVAAGALAVMLSSPVEEQVASPLYELSVLGSPLDVETGSAPRGQAR